MSRLVFESVNVNAQTKRQEKQVKAGKQAGKVQKQALIDAYLKRKKQTKKSN